MVERILRWYGTTSRFALGQPALLQRGGRQQSTATSARTGRNSLNLIPLAMAATLGLRPPVQVFGDDYPTPDGTCDPRLHPRRRSRRRPRAGARLPRRWRRDPGAQRRHRRRDLGEADHRGDRARSPGKRCRTSSATGVQATPSRSTPIRRWGATARLDPALRARRDHLQRVGLAPRPSQGSRADPRGLSGRRALLGPVEPAEQDGDRPRVVAQPVAGTLDEAQLGAPVGFGELAGVARRNALVVLAVHHEHRARREATGRSDRAEAPERPRPLVERRREARCPDRADLAGVIEEASGVIGPIVEVGTRATTARPPRPAGRRRRRRSRSTRRCWCRPARPRARPWSTSGGRSPIAGRRSSPAARSHRCSCRTRGT